MSYTPALNTDGIKRSKSDENMTSPSAISAAADEAMNAMLMNLKLPDEEKVEVTYTTRSGDVVTTLKPLRVHPSVKLSEAPESPVLGVAVVGYSAGSFGKKTMMDIYNNHGCFVRWIVEDDSTQVKTAKADIAKLSMDGVQVVSTDRFADVLNDRFVRIVIVGGPPEVRHKRAEEALSANKNVLCDRPIALPIDEAKKLFALASEKKLSFMPMLPGRPGKAFSAVVMSLFSSASEIACQRLLPDDFSGPEAALRMDEATIRMLLNDVAMQDVFAVNFSICMRPLSVSCQRVDSTIHCLKVALTYPNKCVLTIKCGLGQTHLDTQLFKLSGEGLSDMRRVDHMAHANQHSFSAGSNASFHQISESKGLGFTQVYDDARADALEQMYSVSSGATALARRVRPQLMQDNLIHCLKIADAAYRSFASGSVEDINYCDY